MTRTQKTLAESKQDFLKKCVGVKTQNGTDEVEAMAACAEEWNAANLQALVDNNEIRLSGTVELSAGKEQDAARRFSMLAYTGKLIDWGWWGRFIIDLQGMRPAKETMPALRQHDVNRVVGTIDKAETSGSGFCVAGKFSQATRDAKEVLALADEGFPWQSSIGVRAKKILEVAADSTYEINGREVEGPCEVWLESEVFEVSFVPFGADSETAAIAMQKHLAAGREATKEQTQEQKQEEEIMEKENKPEKTKDQPAKLEHRAELSGSAVLELQKRGTALGLDADAVANCITDNMQLSSEAVTAKLFELASANNKSSFSASVSSGRTENEKFAKAAEHALSMRCGIKIDKAEPGADSLRSLSLKDLAKESLRLSGVEVRAMSNMQVAAAVLKTASLASTSDFPSILSNVAAKVARTAYEEAPSTWQIWCGVSDSTDFKPVDRPQLSEAPSLELINENGEYKHGNFNELKETNTVKTYGRAFRITRQAIVNDDLGMFARIPRAFGAAASRRINDLVYAGLTGNQVMSYDGKALFSTDHANTTNKTDFNSEALGSARKAMRTQKGLNDATLNLQPGFLIIPAALETAAEVLLRSVSLPGSPLEHNPWQNRLTPVVEARLDDVSEKDWYLAAVPNQVDTVEVMFLDGIQAPVIEEKETMNIDGREYLVRLDVGVRVLDHRGLVKNNG